MSEKRNEKEGRNRIIRMRRNGTRKEEKGEEEEGMKKEENIKEKDDKKNDRVKEKKDNKDFILMPRV
jgi:hypothetical protein